MSPLALQDNPRMTIRRMIRLGRDSGRTLLAAVGWPRGDARLSIDIEIDIEKEGGPGSSGLFYK